jgi:hypothetical protein
MSRDEIVKLISSHRERLTELKVKRLSLFGSVARGEDRPDSDVDMLVEFDGAATFHGYFDLLFFLEEITGRNVDLVTVNALKPRLKPYIEKDLVDVA